MTSQILLLNASPDSFARLKRRLTFWVSNADLLGEQYRPLEPLVFEAA